MPVWAARVLGVVRLRPIILTAGSMFLELLPVMYGFGGKDYLVAPLALSFGWGLLFATFITLVLIPCFYYIAEDIKGKTADLLSGFGMNMSATIYQPKAPERIIEIEPVPVKETGPDKKVKKTGKR